MNSSPAASTSPSHFRPGSSRFDGRKIGKITGDYLCEEKYTRAHEPIAEAPRECSLRIGRHFNVFIGV